MCKDCGCASEGENVTQVLSVPDMVCDNCKEAVEGALRKLPGVMAADVDLEAKTVKVNFNGTQVSTDQLLAAVAAVGFEVDKDALIEKASSGILGAVGKFFK